MEAHLMYKRSFRYLIFCLFASLAMLPAVFTAAAAQDEGGMLSSGEEEEPLRYTLIVNYIKEDEDEPFRITKHLHEPGFSYNIASPVIEGYRPDSLRLLGTLEEDSEITVEYHVESFLLTIHYRLLDGKAAAPDHRSDEVFGEEYNIHSPSVTGNVAVTPEISGIMPGRDVEWTVFYVDSSALIK